jgi:hypothetical protein
MRRLGDGKYDNLQRLGGGAKAKAATTGSGWWQLSTARSPMAMARDRDGWGHQVPWSMGGALVAEEGC